MQKCIMNELMYVCMLTMYVGRYVCTVCIIEFISVWGSANDICLNIKTRRNKTEFTFSHELRIDR